MSQTKHRPIGLRLTMVASFIYDQLDSRAMAVVSSRYIGEVSGT